MEYIGEDSLSENFESVVEIGCAKYTDNTKTKAPVSIESVLFSESVIHHEIY